MFYCIYLCYYIDMDNVLANTLLEKDKISKIIRKWVFPRNFRTTAFPWKFLLGKSFSRIVITIKTMSIKF